MAANREFFEEVLETLQAFGDITGKAMFGGYGFWDDGDMFALITSGGRLYFKADDDTVERYTKAGSEQFTAEMRSRPAMAMPYWSVPDGILDSNDLGEWVQTAIAVGHATSSKRGRKTPAKKKAPAKKAPVTKRAR